ncbi:MAG: type II secretion system secretin GspD [Magnetococcales bacterium]|nr:type II secretion system secretin GspD [Magnetococcales bacterium]
MSDNFFGAKWRLGWILLFVGMLFWHPEPAMTAAAKFTLNLQGAELRTLIETVSEATGKNFILDPTVKGKVTIVSSQPMTSEELYQVFLSILEVHGFIAVPSGGAVKIVPDNKINFSSIPSDDRKPDPSAPGGETMVRIFPLKFVDATKLLPVLRPLVSPKGFVSAVEGSNLLIVSDYANTIGRLDHILQRVDHPATGAVEVVTLQHASAMDVLRVLQSLEGPAAKTPNAGTSLPQPSFAADERTNSILLGGDKEARIRLRTLITHLDTPVDIIGNTQVVYLRFAKAESMVKVLTSIGEDYQKKAKGEAPSTSRSAVNVQPFESANALVITAPPDLLRTMRTVIDKLDVRRAQVQVEAIIAEITTDRAAEFGVQWNHVPSDVKGATLSTNFNKNNQGIVNLSGSSGGVPNLSQIGNGLSLGFLNGTSTIFGSQFVNLNALLRALRSDTSTNVLQTPTIVTMDNEAAEIIVAENVPFVTGSYTTTNSAVSNPFQTIQRENVGLILKVTPQINEGNSIRLDIKQELSDVKDTPTLGAEGVVTNTRSIKTAVMVEDGQVLVLGGLIRNKQQKSNDRVPVLGDIPVLGQLFRYESNANGKTNLMVFLKPSILRTAHDGNQVTGGKYNAIRGQQLTMPTSTGFMNLEEGTPVLPEINKYMGSIRTPAELMSGMASEQQPPSVAQKPPLATLPPPLAALPPPAVSRPSTSVREEFTSQPRREEGFAASPPAGGSPPVSGIPNPEGASPSTGLSRTTRQDVHDYAD